MAEFATIVKERSRMCKSFDDCRKCPLGTMFDALMSCPHWMISNPRETEDIIMRWSKENPATTNRMKLKEVFGFDVALIIDV